MGVEANTNKTEYVHPLVEHKAGHTHFLLNFKELFNE